MDDDKTSKASSAGLSIDGLGDKQDAERFRWLLAHCTDFMRPVNGALTDGCFKYARGSCFSPREAIDMAMARLTQK